MFSGSSPAELSCRSHKLHWHPILPVPRGILELSHLQKSSSRLKSSRKCGHTLHKPCFIEEKIKAAKRAGVRSAGRASCSQVASVPSPPSHVLQLYRPFQASSSAHTSPSHAVLSIYCRKLAGGGFFPPLTFGAAATTFPRGCVGSWPNKHCPAPLLPHTSSFQACFPRSVVGWCPSRCTYRLKVLVGGAVKP